MKKDSLLRWAKNFGVLNIFHSFEEFLLPPPTITVYSGLFEGGTGAEPSATGSSTTCIRVMSEESASVRVAVRVRPLNAREKVDRCSECINVLDEEKQVVIGKQRSFTYDNVFGQYSAQSDIYDQVRVINTSVRNYGYRDSNIACVLH
jgi:hypothetical protein